METLAAGSPNRSQRPGSPSSRKGWPLSCTSLKRDKKTTMGQDVAISVNITMKKNKESSDLCLTY